MVKKRICTTTRIRHSRIFWFRSSIDVVVMAFAAVWSLSFSDRIGMTVKPVESFVLVTSYSNPIVYEKVKSIHHHQCVNSLQLWSSTGDNHNDGGDVSKVFMTPKNPKKSASPTLKKKKKKNKPRSKAKNLYNDRLPISNNNIATDIALTKISRRSTVTAAQSPPFLVNDDMNGISNDNEQYRRLYEDNRIEKDCIHYETCSGCTIGRQIANTNVIRAAQRYFATERYDGGTMTSTRTPPTTTNYKSTTPNSNHMNHDNKMSSYPLVVPTPTTQWRTQAKLAVANKSKSAWKNTGCIFGLYEKGSHTVVPIPQCVVHHPSINHAIRLLEQATARTGTLAYSENGRDGDLRYVQLQVERMTGHVCLTLVYNAASLKECQPSLSRLVKELTTKVKHNDIDNSNDNNSDDSDGTANHSSSSGSNTIWHSIWCHCNDSTRNNIFSRTPGRWHRLVGPEFMREPIPVERTTTITDTISTPTIKSATSAGWLYFSPLTFRQGNLDGFDILALNVARAVPSGAKVCELYGGVGVLGLSTLAYHFYHNHEPLKWLRCSDENPANVRCFDRSVESLSVDMTQLDRESNRSRPPKYKGNTENEMTIGELALMMESGKSYADQAKRGDTKKVSYMIASAGKALKSGQALGANVLIVDPPRKGLEEEVLEELCKPYEPNQPYVESPTMLSIPDERVNWVNDVQTLIYVSCGFDALASDCDRLLSSRSTKWILQSTTGYILFPGSDHVETVAIFQRK